MGPGRSPHLSPLLLLSRFPPTQPSSGPFSQPPLPRLLVPASSPPAPLPRLLAPASSPPPPHPRLLSLATSSPPRFLPPPPPSFFSAVLNHRGLVWRLLLRRLKILLSIAAPPPPRFPPPPISPSLPSPSSRPRFLPTRLALASSPPVSPSLPPPRLLSPRPCSITAALCGASF
ncbi:unnamed protein product [Closterium sp. NIES-64]|nr:unnamed protein product [Closterium sp. NIES-64]